MKLSSLIGVLLLLGFCAGTVLAAPGGDQDTKPWSYQFTVRATYPEVEPNDTCPGQAMACGDLISPASFSVASDDDWYVFNVAEAGTWLTLGLQPYQGSDFDTYLELYDSCTGARIAYDDDGGYNMFSQITNFVAPHAGDYYAKAYSYGHYYTGDYEFFLTCTEPVPPPENDTCAGAIAIPSCETGVVAGDLTLAINNYDPGVPGPSCTGYSAAGKDVAYVVDLTAGDMLHLVYTMTGWDASFYVVSDCENETSTCVAGADQGYDVETINWTCDATGTYYIIADCYGSGGGAFTLSYEITCPVDTFVCCVGHDCYLFETEQECTDMQGRWHPEWTSCSDSPCDIYTPADPNSWGQIKNAYR